MHRLLISAVLVGLLVIVAWPTQATPPKPNGGKVDTLVVKNVGQGPTASSGENETHKRVIALSTSDADVKGFKG
jgi:hypothetical protein